uniref:Partner and localiser of BRCA2 WD40 domain-containing protein n=1 Tax=Anolis carolinensis TaxID=28377 RepID=A0A803SLW5_ANOCA
PTKPASVSFRPDPEVFVPEDTLLPLSPASKSTKQDYREVLFGSEKKEAPLSRGRTRARRRITLPLEKRAGPAPEALWGDGGSPKEQRSAWAGLVGSQSPVFERKRISSVWEDVPKWSAAATDGSSCDSTPLLLRPECAQETVFPSYSQPLPSPPSCISHVPSKDRAGEKTLPQEDKDPTLGRFTDSIGRHDTQEEGRSEQEPQASHFFKEEPPTKTLQEKHIEGPLDLDSSLQEEEVPPTALSFCTMVEGLLFPVEYYVRTTRRMSSRQTEVNVEAVIQSQLGRSRKGQKVSRKAVLSSQKAAEIPGQPNTNNRVLSPAVSSNGGLAERLLGDAVQEHLGSTHPRNASGWAFPCAIFPFLFTERSGCLPVSPIRLSLASSVLPLCNQSSAASLLQWLPPSIPALKDFCLPEDEFGLLKSEKIKACAAVTAAKGLAAKAEGSTAGEHLSDTSISATPEVSAASPLASHLAPRRLSSDLLLSPVLEASSGPLLSSLPSPAFPFLGATPASPSFPASQAFCASPSQGRPGTKGEASSPFPRSGTKGQRRTSLPAEEEEEEVLTCVICKSLEIQGSFLFFSPCPGQSCAGPSSSFVDVSTVWWEVDGFTALCVVTASEGSVSLWRPLDSGHWALIHTWHFTKVGAVHAGRIIRVGRDHMAWFCVALAILEIAEIRLLFHSGEGVSVKQSVVKAGNIKAVLGLRKRRLVTSCGSVREQEVEVASFSEMGR